MTISADIHLVFRALFSKNNAELGKKDILDRLLGKNYLRAQQQRDLLSILPDGSRVYEFYPWEQNISQSTQTYVGQDVPILPYLERLERVGEKAEDYWSIWNYY